MRQSHEEKRLKDKAYRDRKCNRKTADRPLWTAEQDAVLRRLYPDPNVTIDAIAARLGKSPKALWNRARRLDLVRSGRAADDGPARTNRSRPSGRPGGKPAGGPPERPQRAPAPKAADLIKAHQRPTGRCEWPMWPDDSAPTFEYCGERREPGSPYCLKHKRMSRSKIVLAPPHARS